MMLVMMRVSRFVLCRAWRAIGTLQNFANKALRFQLGFILKQSSEVCHSRIKSIEINA